MLFARFERRPFTVLLITHDYSMVSEVLRRYGPLRDRISFQEVTASEGRLKIRPFMPER